MNETERTASRGPRRSAAIHPFLFLALEAARPEVGGARLSLAGVETVAVGRGDARAIHKPSASSRVIAIPDARMSASHARLVRKDGATTIEDAGSTNGTLVNGAPATAAPLRDGDVIELGQTFFVYREIEGDVGRVPDLEAGADATQPGLATLDPLLARRYERLARIASAPLPLLLLGETGTGKEVLARAVHALSKRPGPLRRRQLRRHPPRARREPPLRPRARRVLGGCARRTGARPRGDLRNSSPRRDRRSAAGVAGRALAGAPRGRGHPRGQPRSR